MSSTKSIAIGSGAGIVLLIVIIAGIFFFSGGSSLKGTISEEALSNMTEFSLKENAKAKFISNNETYTMKIDSISDNSINITILNTTIITKINIGQIRNFDLEDDGTKDITIQLNNISEGKAEILIKKFFECIENWTCTEWSTCNDENQTRKCTDTKNCATELNKPNEFKECQFNCSQKKGILCSKTQTCNGTITSSGDGECCIGKCEGTATGIEIGVCGDIDCLISAADKCSVANLTYTAKQTNNGTWKETIKYYYKIRGFDDENCEFYTEILSATGSFTDSKKQTFLSEGKTEDEISQMEESITVNLEGKSGVCRFSVYLLRERLEEVKNGNEFVTEEDIHKCSGELYE